MLLLLLLAFEFVCIDAKRISSQIYMRHNSHFFSAHGCTSSPSSKKRAIKQIRGNHSTSDTTSSTTVTNQKFTWDEMYKMRELQSLLRLPYHRNIVQLYEVHRNHNGMVSFVMEYMSQGTLLDLMEAQCHASSGSSTNSNGNKIHTAIESPRTPTTTTKQQVSHSIVRHLVHQILLGVQHLHTHHIYHRDLKPENILLGPHHVCKIADFSLARADDETSIPTSYVSTRWYRAPEILLRSTQYASPVDIWAIGCIASELYTYEPLFPGRDECDQLNRIFTAFGTPQMVHWKDGIELLQTLNIQSWQNRPDDFHESPHSFMVKTLSSNIHFSNDNVNPTVVVEFLLSLLALDPAQRIDTNTALRHQYFNDITTATTTTNTTASPTTAFENVSHTTNTNGRQVTQPSFTVNNDKEDGEILSIRTNTRPIFSSKNNQDTTNQIISPQNPFYEKKSKQFLPHGSVFNDQNDVGPGCVTLQTTLDDNHRAFHLLPPPTKAVPPFVPTINPYKKGRLW